MAKVQVTSEVNIDTEQLLEGVAQLDTPELTHFLSRVGSILASRSNLPTSETVLIQKINQGPPATIQQHYDELQAKLRDKTLSPEEHQTLLDLIDVVELASAERLKHLIALAQLRQVSVDEVMKQLEIQTPPVHV
ncbi:STAS/SEC14 domain-containing protein [cf. Phormidesmis sp. LEGE 11477]|uniref:STAS/SEC14 domain-containing protein n=1 Tax=cf. Phormidesmis sp. LEGE 11477 TaxID=1828680 RepID=UPI00187E4B1C|nr:STAS/SEC14 domain-containing protein [cf. Phormidesmis sp. LEGE 11477]MBE9064397.1 STAS/SEC14 domain-containing protein [cf. Phormidesmis sp. LEGE 11477]